LAWNTFCRLVELGLKVKGEMTISTASAMDRSRGASVEDVGQEESKRGLYRKNRSAAYVGSVKTKARELNLILSRRLKKVKK